MRKIRIQNRSLSGRHTGAKSEGLSLHESSLERDLIYTLEFDNTVKSYVEQPVTIEYLDEFGKKRKYTPDFLIHYDDGDEISTSLLVEVKYREDLWKDWKLLRPKFKAAIDYASRYGWKFKILTEVEIRTDYQKNARFLQRYTKCTVEKPIIDHLLALMRKFEVSDPEEMLIAASDSQRIRGEYLRALWYLVAHGWICADLGRALNMKSEIWVNDDLR